jgi:ABC-2 type transport system permease protein
MVAPEGTFRPQPARYGEVYDRGYKHYEGERLGRGQAFRALIRYSIQRALGIKKRWTAKIVPIILYTVAAGTVLILIGIESFLPDTTTMSYADYFGFIFVVLGMFVATIAPEMLCPDRRENVLSLYFARAITRLDYVLAKLAAAAILTLTISFIPAALLWLFRQLLADAPLSALADNIGDLGKIALAGTAIAFYLGAIGLVISSFTGRKAIAVPVIIVGYLITEGLVNTVAFALDERNGTSSFAANDPATISDWLRFLSPANLSGNLAVSLFPNDAIEQPPFEWWAYAAAMGVTIVIACAIMVWRYVPED